MLIDLAEAAQARAAGQLVGLAVDGQVGGGVRIVVGVHDGDRLPVAPLCGWQLVGCLQGGRVIGVKSGCRGGLPGQRVAAALASMMARQPAWSACGAAQAGR